MCVILHGEIHLLCGSCSTAMVEYRASFSHSFCDEAMYASPTFSATLSRQTWVAVAPQGEISTYVVPPSKWIDFISINYGSTSRRPWND